MARKLVATFGTFALIVGFSGCGANDGGNDSLTADDPSIDTTGGAATVCPAFTTSVGAHVNAGRATQAPFFFWTAYYANGPAREGLGFDASQTVTLYPAAGGGYTTNAANCPPVQTPGCGDGIIQTGEQCDGTNLGGLTCLGLGSSSGRLQCTASCTLDTSGCEGSACGNNVAEGAEQCDGTDLRGKTCADIGLPLSPVLPPGTLRCSNTCTAYEISGCNTQCGDGVLQADEECEGTNFGAHRCQDYIFGNSFPFAVPTPYGGGQLTCQACRISFTSCTPAPGCYYQYSRGGVPVGVQCR
jgi:hypothetical protein